MTFHASRAKGITYALLATLLFGLNASTSHVIVAAGIDPTLLTTFRTGSTAVLCGLVVAFTNRDGFKLHRNELLPFALLGVVGQALMIWCYTETVSRIPVGIALLFEYTAIVMIPLVGWIFFKKRPGKGLWFGVAFVLAGMVVVAKAWDSQLETLGVVFGLLTAVNVTVYFVVGDRLQQRRDSFSTLFHAMWIATLFWLVVRHPQPSDLPDLASMVNLQGNLAGLELPMWVMLLWLATIGSFVPFFFAFSGLRHLKANIMGVISTSETLFAFLFGWLWLSQTIDGIQVIGGVLVISGILVTQLTEK